MVKNGDGTYRALIWKQKPLYCDAIPTKTMVKAKPDKIYVRSAETNYEAGWHGCASLRTAVRWKRRFEDNIPNIVIVRAKLTDITTKGAEKEGYINYVAKNMEIISEVPASRYQEEP